MRRLFFYNYSAIRHQEAESEFLISLNSEVLVRHRTNLLPSLEEHKRPSLPVLATANFDEHLPRNLHPKGPEMGPNQTNVTRKSIKCVGSSNRLR